MAVGSHPTGMDDVDDPVRDSPGPGIRRGSEGSDCQDVQRQLQKPDTPLSKMPSEANISFASSVSVTKSWKNLFRKPPGGVLGVMHNLSKRNRLVSKHGKIHTFVRQEEAKEHYRLLKDFCTSMINLTWPVTFIGFAASFFLSWLMFAIIWYLVAYVHGDLEQPLPSNHKVCVDNLKDFTSCFLFSLETQHTIGYGGRATTERCSFAIIVMSIQSILGVIIQACMAGIVFAKFTKASRRGDTILFSKNALISMRNGCLYLLVRVGDLRPSHLIECHVSGHFLSSTTTEEGEIIPHHLETIKFTSYLEDDENEYLQLFWPQVVGHKIDSSSPLYEFSARDINNKQFEIILTLEGTTPETGNTVQARSSYLPSEILWGQRFQHNIVDYDNNANKFAVTYRTLNSFEQDMTPRCSARDMENTHEVTLR